MTLTFASILLIILFIWVALLTYFLARMISHYNRLIGNTPKGTIKEILDTVLENQTKMSKDASTLEKQISAISDEMKLYIQRVGFVRFNPFADTGGSQSFTLAFLDSKNNGIVMTSLYTRTGGRWYIKHVKDGKGTDLELSKEEQTAVSKAKYIFELKG
jgi:hypothetical protein